MAIKNLGKVVPEKGVDYFTDEDIQFLNIPKNTSDLNNDSLFATENYVKTEIANAQLGGGTGWVDLSEYATKKYVDDAVNNVEIQSSANIYIGPNEPTGDNLPLYWLDTNGSSVPEQPDVPDAPEATLTGITATYSGNNVTVGTTITDLTGITVKAIYSDGSSKTVTNYSLSGTINEGDNIITVIYQGMTATFNVIGIAESGGEEQSGISAFILDLPWLGSKKTILEEDITSSNNPAIIAAGNPSADRPLTEYFNSNYNELYVISYRPNASDPYGGPTHWRAYRYGTVGVPVWQEETQIAEVAVNSTSGVDANKLKIHKLVRDDILAALDSTEYSESDVRAIIQNIPNVGSKNYNVSLVWMATMPTEEQQQAILEYFENGGEV